MPHRQNHAATSRMDQTPSGGDPPTAPNINRYQPVPATAAVAANKCRNSIIARPDTSRAEPLLALTAATAETSAAWRSGIRGLQPPGSSLSILQTSLARPGQGLSPNPTAEGATTSSVQEQVDFHCRTYLCSQTATKIGGVVAWADTRQGSGVAPFTQRPTPSSLPPILLSFPRPFISTLSLSASTLPPLPNPSLPTLPLLILPLTSIPLPTPPNPKEPTSHAVYVAILSKVIFNP